MHWQPRPRTLSIIILYSGNVVTKHAFDYVWSVAGGQKVLVLLVLVMHDIPWCLFIHMFFSYPCISANGALLLYSILSYVHLYDIEL